MAVLIKSGNYMATHLALFNEDGINSNSISSVKQAIKS